MNQDNVFLKGEGDAWYARNSQALKEKEADRPLALVDKWLLKEDIRAIAEFGCSNGYRLAGLARRFRPASVSGSDISAKAVEEGKKLWPALDLRQAPLSSIPFKEPFDLAVVNFVLHWVDRSTLKASLDEIDRLVKRGGWLIVGDFLPDAPKRTKYHHLPNEEVFTFKEDYPALFAARGYREIERVVFNHDEPSAPEKINDSNRAVCALLRK